MQRIVLVGAIAASVVFTQQKTVPPFRPTPEQITQVGANRKELSEALKRTYANPDLKADAEVYLKAIDWILRYPDEFYTANYLKNTHVAFVRGMARAEQLQSGRSPWTTQRGRLARAYRSRVDGSVQPYGLLIPDSYDPARPSRIDVVLHGRAATMNEVSFLATYDSDNPVPADLKHIQLNVFGRTNNAYRWAGETDVFEAVASVQSRYNIDPSRIVLRGFSMGGAGAWHLGLHHPDRWTAVEAGAGFVETKVYARLTNLPDYQEKALRIYDALSYAENIQNFPVVGYGGEEDPQLKASQWIQQAVTRFPNLRALFLIGPSTGHKWHPDSAKESDRFIDAALENPPPPEHAQCVTYTPRYNSCFCFSADALERQYERALVAGTRESIRTENVSLLTLRELGSPVIDGQQMKRAAHFEKLGGKWRVASSSKDLRKSHGLQGPIDDAFMESFIVVNPSPEFTRDWAKWMRGDLRVKAANEITQSDLRSSNLVLFGEPDTNSLIKEVNRSLPIRWIGKEIVVGHERFSAADHLLVLIYPNPLSPNRYVVLNSGHTFGEKEFRGTNALLFPRLGDWAILRKRDRGVVRAGLFDEKWRLVPTKLDKTSQP